MAIFRFAYVFVSKVNIICILCRFGLVLPKIQRAISEGSVTMSVTSAGSVCAPYQPRPRPSAAEPPPLPPPSASLRELPGHTGRVSPACLAVKLGNLAVKQATGAWLAGGGPARPGLSARAAARPGASPWLLCRVCSRVSMPSSQLSLAQRHQLCSSWCAQPRAPLAFASEFPHVPTCPEDTHSWLLIPREG